LFFFIETQRGIVSLLILVVVLRFGINLLVVGIAVEINFEFKPSPAIVTLIISGIAVVAAVVVQGGKSPGNSQGLAVGHVIFGGEHSTIGCGQTYSG
jgi:hypothetical protein